MIDVVRFLTGSKIADNLQTALNTLVVTSLGLRYDGNLNDMYYRIGFMLNGAPKTLEFVDRDSGVLVTVMDLLSIVGKLGKEVLTALAPLDLTLDMPAVEADQICTPPFPCTCEADIYCPLRRHRRARRALGANVSMAGKSSVMEDGDQPTGITVSYLNGDGQAASTVDADGIWEEDVENDIKGDINAPKEGAGVASEDLGQAMAEMLEGQLSGAMISSSSRGANSGVKIVRMVAQPGRMVPYVPKWPGTALRNESLSRRVVLPPLSRKQEEAIRRRLAGCSKLRPYEYRMRMLSCCGERRCVTPKLSLGGSLRLTITDTVAAIEGSMRLQLMGPGMGLPSIDETKTGRLEIAYAEAKTICDFIPGLKTYCLPGSIGGGSATFDLGFMGITYSLTISFDVAKVCLVDILPCSRIPV